MKKFLFYFFILTFTLTPYIHATVKSAQLAIDVPAGKWKTVRLKNLPMNAAVKVEIKSEGAVTLFFIDQKNYEKYPNIKRPLFKSRVINTLSFTVKIPSTGHYYLIFDNVAGVREARLDVTIYGASGADSVLM